MKTVVIFLFLLTSLYGEREFPRFFASMGDPLYTQTKGYDILMQSEHFEDIYSEMGEFIILSHKTQTKGHSIDKNSTSTQRIEYMNLLRALKDQDEMLKPKIIKILDRLFHEKRYAYLSSLRENPSDTVRNSQSVKASVMINDGVEIDMQNSATTYLQITFERYKKQLLQAREAQEDTECLNDLTALYHHFISLEKAKESEDIEKSREIHNYLKPYMKSLRVTCKSTEDIQKAEEIAKRY
jgi:hypothetical protein